MSELLSSVSDHLLAPGGVTIESLQGVLGDLAGPGTGLDGAGVAHKAQVIDAALALIVTFLAIFAPYAKTIGLALIPGGLAGGQNVGAAVRHGRQPDRKPGVQRQLSG